MAIKSFGTFCAEDNITYALKRSGIDSISLANRVRRSAFNASLAKVMSQTFPTPYMGIGGAARILAHAAIIFPQVSILNNEEGHLVFGADAFGEHPGIFVYYEWRMLPGGEYMCRCEVVDVERLEELVHSDLDNDGEKGESPEHKAKVFAKEEDLQEISKKLAGNYIKRASVDLLHGHHPSKKGGWGRRRSDGIDRATDKITGQKDGDYGPARVKATEEDLQEISRGKLRSYANKALNSTAKHLDNNTSNSKKINKRLDNVGRAIDKRIKSSRVKVHATEEPLLELSRKTLSSYVKKASTDSGYHHYNTAHHIARSKGQNEKDKDKSLDRARNSSIRAAKRIDGVHRAADKLAKEDWASDADKKPWSKESKESKERNKKAPYTVVKPVKEEPLDEISKGLANRYIERSTGNKNVRKHVRDVHRSRIGSDGGKNDHFYKWSSDREAKKVKNRESGVRLAAAKVSGKHVNVKAEEPINELSKDKLQSYQAVAVSDARKVQRVKDAKVLNDKQSKRADHRIEKRLKGIGDANKRIQKGYSSIRKEEDLQELSGKTMHRYIKKATGDHKSLVDKAKSNHWKALDARDSRDKKMHNDAAADQALKAVKRKQGIDRATKKLDVSKVPRNEEPINELSKNTLRNYVKKAATNRDAHANLAHHYEIRMKSGDSHPMDSTYNKKSGKSYYQHWHNTLDGKAKKRQKGIRTAAAKIQKEEDLQELSKEKLRDYVGKATRDLESKDGQGRAAWNRGDYKAFDKKLNHGMNRAHHILKAKDKLRGEEPINELSKKTLGSYIKKATNDVSYHSFSAGDQMKGRGPNSEKHDAKAFSRQKGVEKATDRLMKDTFPGTSKGVTEEPINELSKNTLRSYIKGANGDVKQRAHAAGHDLKRGRTTSALMKLTKNSKRITGMVKASTKINKKGLD